MATGPSSGTLDSQGTMRVSVRRKLGVRITLGVDVGLAILKETNHESHVMVNMVIPSSYVFRTHDGMSSGQCRVV